jgi:hypothetical protein
VVITTSDEALTKGYVRYLEARLIEMALGAGRVSLDNGQAPNSDKRRMPEADRANMEAFLANLKVILPVVGLDLLKPRPVSTTKATSTSPESGQVSFEIRHRSGVKAVGVEEEGEFVVLQGSQALKDAGYQDNAYGELKQELIAQGVLGTSADGKFYEFVRPYTFKSPSAAAAVVLDRNSNGRLEWKVVGSRLTYHQWQEEKAKASEIGEIAAQT